MNSRYLREIVRRDVAKRVCEELETNINASYNAETDFGQDESPVDNRSLVPTFMVGVSENMHLDSSQLITKSYITDTNNVDSNPSSFLLRGISMFSTDSVGLTLNNTLFETDMQAAEVADCAKRSSEIDLQTELANWAVSNHVSQCSFNKLLRVLKKPRKESEYEKLPFDCRVLLKTEKADDVTHITSKGSYYHFGILEGVLHTLTTNSVTVIDQNILKLDINVDGLPLAKSSGSQFWPVLGSILEHKPFVIGVFHGFKKPEKIADVLGRFVEEFLKIGKNGFLYKNRNIQLELGKFICDAPAKSFVLGIKGHNSYFGCTKCTTEGTFLNNRMAFPDLNATLRTDDAFRSGIYDEDYHITETPLKELPLGLVSQFPLDYMHLVCLGVMKRLILFWVKGNRAVRMNIDDIKNVSSQLHRFRQSINSSDFARLPRPLEEVDRWKASEFRLFLLYLGPVVLKHNLQLSKYVHFLALHCAIRILISPSLCIHYNDYAKKLLIYFIEKYSDIYGPEYITHNVHNLSHLCDDVLAYGCLDNFSAFKYENCMSDIKRMLKTSNKPLEQFVNRIRESRKYTLIHSVSNANLVLTKPGNSYKETLLGSKYVTNYESVKYNNFLFGTKHKNNHCVIRNHIIARIENIIRCDDLDEVFIIYKKYGSFHSYFHSPCNSKLFSCGIIRELCDEKEIVSIKEVTTKCIHYKNCVISFII